MSADLATWVEEHTSPPLVRRQGPWSELLVARLVIVNAAALVALLASWFQTAAANDVSDRLAWLNVSVAAIVVVGLTNGMWVLGGRRKLGQARAALLDELTRTRSDRPVAAATTTNETISGPGMTWFHEPGCPLLRCKSDLLVDTNDRRLDSGLRPCPTCLP